MARTSSRPRLVVARRRFIPRLEKLDERVAPAAGVGVFVPTTHTFSLHNTAAAGPADTTFQFNATGSIAISGDWNGDGKDDFGVFDSKTATWSLRYGAETGPENAGNFVFGKPGTLPVVGDWNGDGR